MTTTADTRLSISSTRPTAAGAPPPGFAAILAEARGTGPPTGRA